MWFVDPSSECTFAVFAVTPISGLFSKGRQLPTLPWPRNHTRLATDLGLSALSAGFFARALPLSSDVSDQRRLVVRSLHDLWRRRRGLVRSNESRSHAAY